MPIITSNKRIFPAQTVVQLRQLFGAEICAERWFAMHVVFTSNFMVSIDRTQCDAILFTPEDGGQKVTSPQEEVSH